MKYLLAVTLTLLVGVQNVIAHTTSQQDFTCPIGGEVFSQQMSASGTQFGLMLDLKPYGPTAAPWPLAECPSNGFVLYKRQFSDVELQKLSVFIQSADYPKGANAHFRAFLLKKHLDDPLKEQFFMLLNATWRTYGPRAEYALMAISLADQLLKDIGINGNDRVTIALLRLEYLRRLAKFELALEAIADVESGQPTNAGVLSVLACQRELVLARSSKQSPMPNKTYKCGDFVPPAY